MGYRVNAPQVIAETIGGETIIVNLTKGHYFNLLGAGVDVWDCIERGEGLTGTVAYLETRFEAGNGEIESSVARLLAELEAEELIVQTGAGDTPADAQPPASPPPVERAPFAEPALAKFTDMQDIILLDPVHEVEPRGWPHSPTGA